jgi:hypothetical protein
MRQPCTISERHARGELDPRTRREFSENEQQERDTATGKFVNNQQIQRKMGDRLPLLAERQERDTATFVSNQQRQRKTRESNRRETE